jgi:hypothetical protein
MISVSKEVLASFGVHSPKCLDEAVENGEVVVDIDINAQL